MNFFAITAEMARVYGIQFEEVSYRLIPFFLIFLPSQVMTRGTQLRVESMLLRFCRRLGLFAPSITPEQRNQWVDYGRWDISIDWRMRAPEQLQLVMEPQSGVYFDPVIVLDFQVLRDTVDWVSIKFRFSLCIHQWPSHTTTVIRRVWEEYLNLLPSLKEFMMLN